MKKTDVNAAGTSLPTPATAETQPAALTDANIKAIEFKAFDNGRAEGQASERARIGAILSAWQASSGQALGMAAVAIEQGLSAEAATAMIQAHATALASASKPGTAPEASAFRQAWLSEGQQQVDPADSATGEEAPADDASDPEAAATRQWERDAALRAEFGNDKARFVAFRAATAAGRVKILRESRAAALATA